MTTIRHNPPGVFPPYRAYAHATEIRGDARLLFVSGLNGYEADGKTLPESFDAQAELIWTHLRTILASAGMGQEISPDSMSEQASRGEKYVSVSVTVVLLS